MFFWIKESKLEKVIMRYIQLQNLERIENNVAVFFLGGIGGKFADITFVKSENLLDIKKEFLVSICNFFSIDEKYAQKMIVRYFKEIMKFKIKNVNVFSSK